MTNRHPLRILLGPQSPTPTVGAATANLLPGPFAVISAGWQETEGDLDELSEAVGRPLEDLRLYRRTEDLTGRDAGLADAIRERQDRLIEQQRLYRLRLKQLGIAARHTLGAEGDAEILAAEQRHAIAQLRALDRHHLRRSEAAWQTFFERFAPETYAPLARHAEEITTIIERSAGVIVTGGNVAVLINRMRLFGVGPRLADRDLVAWSAGAMALARRIVLFHDRSPDGRREAEVFGAGCGLIPGYVCLPNAKHRLRAGDRMRIGLMSRRFAPDHCIALDNAAELHLDATGIRKKEAVRRLGGNGRLTRLEVA